MYADNFHGTKPFSDTCSQLNLATNTEQTYTVPGTKDQKYRAIFTFASNSNVFVGLNVTAASPGSGLKTSTANLEFKPCEPKYVKGGDVIHMVSPDAAGAYVGISLLML
jgi:hypothetical protein